MIPLLLIGAAAHGGPIVTLSGHNFLVTDGASPFDSKSGFRINTDGTLDELDVLNGAAAVYTQVDAATDWIIPNDAAAADYEMRVTNVVHTGHAGWTGAASADDVWIDLSSNREWFIVSTSAQVITTDFDIQVRRGSGVTLASNTYQAQINNFV